MKIRNTKASSAVIRILEKEKKPLDVEDFIGRLNRRKINVDRTTVFRIVNKLTEARILTRLEFDEGKARYELTSLPHHHHAICTKCRKVEDIKECNIREVKKNAENNLSFKIEFHRIELFGKCHECRSIY